MEVISNLPKKSQSALYKSRVIPIISAETFIPKGSYCYESLSLVVNDPSEGVFTLKAVNPCTFRSINQAQVAIDEGSYQSAGYCSYLKVGDWMDTGLGMLWDSVKECGVKDEDEGY